MPLRDALPRLLLSSNRAANGAGTSGEAPVTSGECATPERDYARLWPIVAMIWLALIVSASVNALGRIHDLHATGQTISDWQPWVWELSSAMLWVALTPFVGVAVIAARPPGPTIRRIVIVHGLAAFAACAAHISGMVAVREAVYAVMAHTYDFGWSLDVLFYEARKDLFSYALIASLIWLWLRFEPLVRTQQPLGNMVVRDGAKTFVIDIETITRVEAAGNYVELHSSAGPVLRRSTLTTVAQELAPYGFVQVHRGRLVNASAVVLVEATPAGDFQIKLCDGVAVAGSRRYRENIRVSLTTLS